MSSYSARRSVSIGKRKKRSWYSGGHMNYPADSTAKLCQGGKGRYVDREGVPVDNCSRVKCEPVIVYESLDLSVC